MKSRVLVDINIILDYFDLNRRKKFPYSVKLFEFIKNNKNIDKFISSSSLDNIAFIKLSELKENIWI